MCALCFYLWWKCSERLKDNAAVATQRLHIDFKVIAQTIAKRLQSGFETIAQRLQRDCEVNAMNL
jgi:hypothetical protein